MSSLRCKTRLTYVAISLMFFMGGIEYAVILPTIWLYLKTDFHAPEYMLGLMLSGYSLAAIVAGPLMGRWSDRSRKPKFLLLVGILFEVAGNIMYFMGISVWFLFGSRLVAGVGGGAEAVLLAEITRNSDEDKRTGLISVFVAIRQCGLLVGPGLNLFLREMNFDVYGFHVTKYNAPGAFMACVWLIQMAVILFLYTDLHVLKAISANEAKTDSRSTKVGDSVATRTEYSQDSRHRTRIRTDYDEDVDLYKQIDHYRKSPCGADGSDSDADNLMENAENFIKSRSNMSTMSTGSKSSLEKVEVDFESDGGIQNSYMADERMSRKGSEGSQDYIVSNEETLEDYLKGKSKLKFMYREYVREEIVTVLGTQFNSFFNQVALETMATPLANTLLDWGEIENSVMYCVAGVEIIAVFMFVRWLSKRLMDRTLMLIGLVTMTASTAWLLYAIPHAKPHEPKENLWRFVISLVLDMFALPFLVASSISLYSKITRKETQGLSMGLRRSVIGLATILGPLWAGSTIPWPYVMFGVMLALLATSLFMMLLSYGKLKSLSDIPANQAGIITTVSSYDETEHQPLLA